MLVIKPVRHAEQISVPARVRQVTNRCIICHAGSERIHGLDCLMELLGFEISLIKSGGEGVHTDLNVFGLDLLAATLSAGQSGMKQDDQRPCSTTRCLLPCPALPCM